MNDLALIIVLMVTALGIGVSNILCFLFGFKMALKTNGVTTSEPLKVPKVKRNLKRK